MGFFNRNKKELQRVQWKIKRSCLDLILESAKSTYPNEFGALLRVDEQHRDTIVELVLLPGTISGDSHAIFRLHMMPIDFSIVGTVHSHPGPSARPSEADLMLFRKHGKIHIIASEPFTYESWKAYDYDGNNVDVLIV